MKPIIILRHISEMTSRKSKSATSAGKSEIILEADLLLSLTFDKKIIERCDDTRLLLYYDVKCNLFYCYLPTILLKDTYAAKIHLH